MSEKLYEKYQQPKPRFYADWTWRILCLLGVALLSWARLWGDDRYVPREEVTEAIISEVSKAVNADIKARLKAVEILAESNAIKTNHTVLSESYVTRREFNLILTTLKRIEDKLE